MTVHVSSNSDVDSPDKSLRLEQAISSIHTLGPSGTNCEKAAQEWFLNRGYQGDIHLYATLEIAALEMQNKSGSALLACIVYPELHTLVFSNFDWLILTDSLIVPTHNMVLAAREDTRDLNVISCHPAPISLIPAFIKGTDKARFSIPSNFARIIRPDYTRFQALDFNALPY